MIINLVVEVHYGGM